MAQVSMLETSRIPTQSNCQQHVRTSNTACYVGPKIISTKVRSDMMDILNVITIKQKNKQTKKNMINEIKYD